MAGKVKPIPTSKAEEGVSESFSETKNVFKASKKAINGSNSNDWKKIAKDARKNIK